MDVATTCQVTHTGAEINLSKTGISLMVPPDAIPEGTCFEISLSLSLHEDYPELEEGHMLICPIVKCQPSGTHFLKPSILTLPCNAGNDIGEDLTVWTKRNLSGEKLIRMLITVGKNMYHVMFVAYFPLRSLIVFR